MDSEPIDWRRRIARRAIVPAVLTLIGLAIVVAADDSTWDIIGWAVVGVAVTVAIAYVFLEVGYSEDRERARRP